jgi:hypothetical protein
MAAHCPWLDVHRSTDPSSVPVIETADGDEPTKNDRESETESPTQSNPIAVGLLGNAASDCE